MQSENFRVVLSDIGLERIALFAIKLQLIKVIKLFSC